MTPFFEWFANEKKQKRDWVIFGKGPTFSKRLELDTSSSCLLGINDVCTVLPVDITHVADAHAIDRVGDALLDFGGSVVMPYYPHVYFKPDRSCDLVSMMKNDCGSRKRILRKLDSLGRLLFYRSSRSWKWPHPPCGATVNVRLFSAVAAAFLLLAGGVKSISMVGVDGGTGYASEFEHIQPLANGRCSFDGQGREIRKLAKRFRASVKWPISPGALCD